MNAYDGFLRMATLRWRLILRQKAGWLGFSLCAVCVFLSLIFARASYLAPERIFWDFSLGSCFVVVISLAIYLGSQLFADEQHRRTLHLVLSSGVSRGAWLHGNVCGIWLNLLGLTAIWWGLTGLTSWVIFHDVPAEISFQVQWALIFEVLIVLWGTVAISLCVRPLLAMAASASGVFFLHSLSSLERIFSDPESGHLMRSSGIQSILSAARWAPQLEWFDLRVFIGYEASFPWSNLLTLTTLGLLWALLFSVLGSLRFERMDL